LARDNNVISQRGLCVDFHEQPVRFQ
jgi:hypothetical protein